MELKKEVCSIFNVGGKNLHKGLQMVIDKLRDLFRRMATAGYDWSARVALLMDFGEYIEATCFRVRVRREVFQCLYIN